jgi:ADP-ribosylglycohydrolase
MPAWTTPKSLLEEEFVQRADEGCTIPGTLRRDLEALEPDAPMEAVEPVYDALMALEPDPALSAREPNDLEAIRALRPEGPRELGWDPGDAELRDRLHGAWLGRCVGCALGKPVEGIGLGRDEQGRLNGRASIRAYLQNRNAWPLRDFFPDTATSDGLRVGCPASTRERIAHMESDDDIRYTVTGLLLVEGRGPEFTWRDVADFWIRHMAVTQFCTAERQAVLNFLEQGRRGAPDPAWIRRHRNPYREWIGAQIRCDGFAWAAAGKPERAAEFAWRDAHWTHERNGIYGEMFMAAMQAAAFVETDPARLVEIGLSEIPRECRLARAVRECLEWVDFFPDWEACMDNVEKTFPHMHTVHTINNALVCVLALFYGRMDTTEAPAIAVMCGLDTDCNGASVGNLVGAAQGAKCFGGTLAPKLNDTVKANMVGVPESMSLAALAERTAKVWQAVDTWHRRQPATS